MKKCNHCEKEIPNRNVFCDNTCQREYQYRKTIKDWLSGLSIMNYGAIKVSNNIRRYLFETHNSKCEQCGWGEINPYTNKVSLEIDHIDGDSQNNKFENLKLLCPNCHSLTKTWKNAGSRKSTRVRRKK
jgi:Zn finger protein HypA/HybF involved in hydrogenase expression